MSESTPSRSELLELLALMNTLRARQDQTLWIVYGASWATNGLLLLALLQGGALPAGQMAALLAFVGLVASLAAMQIMVSALDRVDAYDEMSRQLENVLALPATLRPSFLRRQRGPRGRDVMTAVNVLAVLGWLALLVTSALRG